MVVVPNGFDLARFRPDAAARASVRAELGLTTGTPLVGIVARYHPQKNVDGFVAAALAVARERPGVHFMLAGSGLEAANTTLTAPLAGSAAAPLFHLLGRRDDVPRLMAAADVLVLSSHGEAFPNVVGEGMACGVSFVSTDAGDAAEIIGDTGRVVPAGDMPGLAREIRAMLDLPAVEREALGRRARQRVQDRYDIERVVEQYQAFYLSLMDGNSTCAG
jgi:glycosyltransferase involved in cell wall biosynthesis